jgi:hypothetical protein
MGSAHMRTVCRNLDNGQQISTPGGRTGTSARAFALRITCKSSVPPNNSGMRPILSVSNCRTCAKRGTPGRPRGLPRCPRTEASLTEDYGQLVISFAFQKHHLGCKAGSEEPLAGPLLCEDVVPIVVTELSFLSPPREFIGEVAYPFLLGSSGGVGIVLLFQRIRIVAFVNQCVGHCAFLLQYFQSICDARADSREQPAMSLIPRHVILGRSSRD